MNPTSATSTPTLASSIGPIRLVSFTTRGGSTRHWSTMPSSRLYARTKYGIDYPYLFGSATKVVPNKIPTIQIGSFGTLDGGPYPSRSGVMVYALGDTITKVWGHHQLKFGFVWEYAGENNYDQISVDNTRPGTTNNQNGLFVFTDGRGGGASSQGAIANAALGFLDT